jgi:hypothetical protein
MDNNFTQEITQEIIDLVVARLETIPKNVEVSIGGEGSFTIEDLIERVKRQDEVGKKMVEMQLAYIYSLSKLPTQQESSNAPHN